MTQLHTKFEKDIKLQCDQESESQDKTAINVIKTNQLKISKRKRR